MEQLELEQPDHFHSSLFLYQALQRPEQFVGHVGGILGNVESRARMYRPEVRVVGAVVAAGDRDVLALEDVRVALHSLLVSGLLITGSVLLIIFLR